MQIVIFKWQMYAHHEFLFLNMFSLIKKSLLSSYFLIGKASSDVN